MTTTLRIEVPWGLIHATPWNRSANEGTVEWPPSPWRLLRALYSAWKIHAPEHGEEEVRKLLATLAGPPRYLLPEFTQSHARHYMPGVAHLEGVATDTDKTFDAFVATRRNAVIEVQWPVELSLAQRVLLAELAGGIRYLGRAESVVDVVLADPGTDGHANVDLSDDSIDVQSVRLLAATLPLDLSALVLSPLQVRGDRRLVPPSTQWLTYVRPQPLMSHQEVRRRSVQRPTAIRLAIAGSVLPSKFDAVALGDLVRRASIKRHGLPSPTLSGKDDDGRLGGLHEHAHYLAWSRDGRRVETVIAWCPTGFSQSEVDAFASLRTLRSEHMDGVGTRAVSLIAAGSVENTASELVGPSHMWHSLTPYSPVGHFRGALETQLLADINRELRLRNMELAAELALVEGSWLRYRRYRPAKERIQRSRPAFGISLRFDSAISGPLALGQLCHFGLGLFVPEQESRPKQEPGPEQEPGTEQEPGPEQEP